MLCLRFKNDPRAWVPRLHGRNVFVDFREPDVIRATPAPLYNSFEDVARLIEVFAEVARG
jgi:kynureninase